MENKKYKIILENNSESIESFKLFCLENKITINSYNQNIFIIESFDEVDLIENLLGINLTFLNVKDF